MESKILRYLICLFVNILYYYLLFGVMHTMIRFYCCYVLYFFRFQQVEIKISKSWIDIDIISKNYVIIVSIFRTLYQFMLFELNIIILNCKSDYVNIIYMWQICGMCYVSGNELGVVLISKVYIWCYLFINCE